MKYQIIKRKQSSTSQEKAFIAYVDSEGPDQTAHKGLC